MKRVLIPLVLLVATTAHAGGRKLLVVRSDSTVDWGTRTRVEATVLGLARHVDRGVAQSDVPFKELAAAVGCVGDVATCKDKVVASLDVDEIVLISIAPTPNDEVTVTVTRAGRGRAPTRARGVVPSADFDKPLHAAIAPLFGLSPRTAGIAPPKKTGGPPPITKVTSTPVQRSDPPADPPQQREEPPPPEPPTPVKDQRPASLDDETPPPRGAPPVATAIAAAEATPATPTATPSTEEDSGRPRTRREKLLLGGVGGGGVLAVVGLVLWSSAGGIEDEIARAPQRTRADVDNILDLEARGDRNAMIGNVAVVTGIAAAGVCGFLYWRSRRAGSDSHVQVTPLVSSGTAGVSLVWVTP